MAVDGAEARVSVGSRNEHGSIRLLQAVDERPAAETARLDARTATIRVGTGGIGGLGESGTVTMQNEYGLTGCELDAETATLTLGNGGTTTGGGDAEEVGGVTDGVQTEPVSTPSQVQEGPSGQGDQPGAIELVDANGDVAAFVRINDENNLEIADSSETAAIRIEENALGRDIVLTDEDGNAALTVEGDGTVTADGAEVET